MVALIILACIIIAAGTAWRYADELDAMLTTNKRIERREQQVLVSRLDELSWPAKQIVKAYDALPAQHRPTYDILSIVKALDFKEGDIAAVNRHYRNGLWGFEATFSMDNCDCVRWNEDSDFVGCNAYSEYIELYNTITGIATALAEREQALADREREIALAGMQADLNMAKELTKELRNEQVAIAAGTREVRRYLR